MPNELQVIDPATLDIPDPRPYIIAGMAGTALIAAVAHRLFKHRTDNVLWGAVSSIASGPRAPREWTSAFAKSDGFLAQLKDITPTELPK